jgi:hypothetical protein
LLRSRQLFDNRHCGRASTADHSVHVYQLSSVGVLGVSQYSSRTRESTDSFKYVQQLRRASDATRQIKALPGLDHSPTCPKVLAIGTPILTRACAYWLEIKVRLAKAPPVKEMSAGKTLGSLLSLSAVSAATFQQRLFSAIVELAIAASLALPELLRPRRAPLAKREERLEAESEPQEQLAPPKPRLVSDQTPALSVADYVAERIKAVKGGRLAFRDVYRDYETTAQRRAEVALDPEQFGGDDWMHPANDAAAIAPIITDELHAMLMKRTDDLEGSPAGSDEERARPLRKIPRQVERVRRALVGVSFQISRIKLILDDHPDFRLEEGSVDDVGACDAADLGGGPAAPVECAGFVGAIADPEVVAARGRHIEVVPAGVAETRDGDLCRARCRHRCIIQCRS